MGVVLKMKLFKFKKKSIKKEIECGYYFKGEFLSRYKTEAKQILRKRIENAGDGSLEKGKKILKDEWKVLHQEWLKSCKTIKKTNRKKRAYYKRARIESKKRKIKQLREELQKLRGD